MTHGEPHAGNLMKVGPAYVFVDWDTVALAPPERDLWMLVPKSRDPLTTRQHVAGNGLDPGAVSYFRLRWDLADIAAFTTLLRSPHDRTPDTEKAYNGLVTCLATRNDWAALLE